ncbi:hypothetical protein KY285_005325 [Solanum tuberosum]|nr:hypothetical protein KY285_005325 [Solanum tuberosum]
MTEYIVENIKPGMTETLDKAWSMGELDKRHQIKDGSSAIQMGQAKATQGRVHMVSV